MKNYTRSLLAFGFVSVVSVAASPAAFADKPDPNCVALKAKMARLFSPSNVQIPPMIPAIKVDDSASPASGTISGDIAAEIMQTMDPHGAAGQPFPTADLDERCANLRLRYNGEIRATVPVDHLGADRIVLKREKAGPANIENPDMSYIFPDQKVGKFNPVTLRVSSPFTFSHSCPSGEVVETHKVEEEITAYFGPESGRKAAENKLINPHMADGLSWLTQALDRNHLADLCPKAATQSAPIRSDGQAPAGPTLSDAGAPAGSASTQPEGGAPSR